MSVLFCQQLQPSGASWCQGTIAYGVASYR